eukprot:scaffold223851_cov16-Prasinocladus_malaysianus.AAC.1
MSSFSGQPSKGFNINLYCKGDKDTQQPGVYFHLYQPSFRPMEIYIHEPCCIAVFGLNGSLVIADT